MTPQEYAAIAQKALDHFPDKENAVSDLLGDLMHWCKLNNEDFDEALAKAQWHHGYEKDQDHVI